MVDLSIRNGLLNQTIEETKKVMPHVDIGDLVYSGLEGRLPAFQVCSQSLVSIVVCLRQRFAVFKVTGEIIDLADNGGPKFSSGFGVNEWDVHVEH